MDKKITVKQLATELGVSNSTVSRALSGKGRIGSEQSERIRKLAVERGFVLSDKDLKRTGNVGIVLPADAWNGAAFFVECVGGIVNTLMELNYDALICMESATGNKSIRRLINSKKADGMILLRTLSDKREMEYLRASGKPCVLIGSCDMDIAQIDTNHIASSRDLTMYLLTHGMKKIAFLGGNSSFDVSKARLKGYLEAHEKLQMPCQKTLVFQDIFNMERVGYIMEELLPLQIDCILCDDDLVCMWALQSLILNGVRVPGDIRVASLNNSQALDRYVPQITSVEVNAKELGMAAGRQILKMLEGKESNSKHLFGYNLLLRGSTGGI